MKKGRKLAFVLNANNEESLLARQGKKEFEATYIDLLQFLAQCLDAAVGGENVWVNIGMTRDRSGLLLTRHWDDDVLFLAAGSMASLSQECQPELSS